MSRTSSKSKQVQQHDNSLLLQDIHLGVKLKSSKHLSSDRSSPVIKGSNSHVAATNSRSIAPPIPTLDKHRISYNEFTKVGPRLVRDDEHSIRPNLRPNTLRASISSTNISLCKPPILHPKPKPPPSLSSSNSNISGNHHNTRDILERMSSIDSNGTDSRRNISARSGVESYATMSRSRGKRLVQEDSESCQGRLKNGSFQQNRLIVSGLFDNGPTSQAVLRKSSLVNLPTDAFETDSLCNKLQSINLPSKNVANSNLANERHSSYRSESSLPPQPNNLNQRRSSKPPPPLPPRGPLIKPERPTKFQTSIDSVDKSDFEEKFKFHSERDFPRPPSFVKRHKSYSSKMSNHAAANQSHYGRTSFTRLVTTV